jgi:hypothetical protein
MIPAYRRAVNETAPAGKALRVQPLQIRAVGPVQRGHRFV